MRSSTVFFDSVGSVIGTTGGRGGWRETWLPSLAFFVVSLILIALDMRDGSLFYGDNDDIAREIQIRDLLKDGAWFDLTYPVVSMPEPYVSHYSRIVDFFYVFPTRLIEPLVGLERALPVATKSVPVLLLAVFSILALRVMQSIAARPIGVVEAGVVALVSCFGILEFAPGRIDHHNFQLVLMAAMLAGITGTPRLGGVLAGFAAAASIAIGLECLPYIVAAFAGVALLAIWQGGHHATRLSSAGAAMALAAIPLAVASFGPAAISETRCDAMSAPWLVMMMAGGAILALAPIGWAKWPVNSVTARLISLALPGALLLGHILSWYPGCIGGFYGDVDPFLRAIWLDRIQQEKSLFLNASASNQLLRTLFAIGLGILVAALPDICVALKERRYEAVVAYAVAITSLIVFLLLIRSVRFPAALVPLCLPLVWSLAKTWNAQTVLGPVSAKAWLLGSVALMIVTPPILDLLAPPRPPQFSVLDQMEMDACSGEPTDVLSAVPPGRILAPNGLTLTIARQNTVHRLGNFPLHRAASGISRMFMALTSSDAAARKTALEPFDYLAVCARDLGVADLDAALLFAQLIRGEAVPGLVPVDSAFSSAFRLYRIDHTALE